MTYISIANRPARGLRLAVLLGAVALTFGCASIVGKATSRLADNLGSAVLNAEDSATVRDGLPAYLLLLDGLLEGDPKNVGSLLAAAKLNGAYASNFTGADLARAQLLSRKALRYAKQATCVENAALCATMEGNPDAFSAEVAKTDSGDLPILYGLASSWAGFIQANRDDWGAVADLPKVEALLVRVVALDETYDGGLPLVYLGVLNSLRPETVGGKPEQGRAYFERAIAISEGRNLYAKTLMAEFYARLMFDRELHDRLLNEVLAAEVKAPSYTLMNTLAHQRAQALLESGKDYF